MISRPSPSLRVFTTMMVLLAVSPAFAADRVGAMLQETHWGELSEALRQQFGAAAERLPQPFDFGDSYADLVLRGETLGGVPVAVFFQMDKTTRGLKRIQLEPLGHRLNPPVYRAVAAALDTEYGRPDQTCVTPPLPAAGYQAAVEERWVRGETAVSAIFRLTRPCRPSKVVFMAPPPAGAGCTASCWFGSPRASTPPGVALLASQSNELGRAGKIGPGDKRRRSARPRRRTQQPRRRRSGG